MKRAIEFRELIENTYRVVVDVPNEETLEEICEMTGKDFEGMVYTIGRMNGVKVLDADSEFDCESVDGIEYADDYWTDSEEEAYT